jgi:hypothetical protein
MCFKLLGGKSQMNSLKSILSGALVAASTILPLSSKAAEVPKPFVQLTFASDYVAPTGIVIPGRCAQTWISIEPVKNISIGTFQNYSLVDNEVNERDLVLGVKGNLTEKLSARAGYQYWHYVGPKFGENDDSVFTAGLNYSGKLNLDLDYAHLNENAVHNSGDRINPTISKSFTLHEGKFKLSLTPSVSTCFASDFFGLEGQTQISGKLGLDFSRDNFTANASITKQDAKEESLSDKTYYSFSFGYKF